MRRGFLYLVAFIDRSTRRVLSWRLSNTLTVGFSVEALGEALVRFSKPGIFNTDQGSQFTSEAFTRMLLDHGIEISMDGRGRCHDNIFVERLWWTVKHEWVYLRPAAKGSRAEAQSRRVLRLVQPTSPASVARAGKHRTRRISARQCRRWQRLRNSMAEPCCEFVDSRLRRYPPDRAGAVPHGQAEENASRFPHLADRSAAVHKLHSAPQQQGLSFSGKMTTFNRLPALAYSSRNLSKRPGATNVFRRYMHKLPLSQIKSPHARFFFAR